AVFTEPMLACVGLAEQDCTPETYSVHKSFYRSNGKALCIGESDGMAKIIVDNASDKIIGASVLGASADLLIQQIADVIALGGTFTAFRNIVHAHPTLSEVLIG
ncbi:MAG: dihydrolipoyl dehydrogenase, partial [Bacteroidales bacterium]|nr:dihydrolipoyl dehydrogenase [Bacteroidales bacterium]